MKHANNHSALHRSLKNTEFSNFIERGYGLVRNILRTKTGQDCSNSRSEPGHEICFLGKAFGCTCIPFVPRSSHSKHRCMEVQSQVSGHPTFSSASWTLSCLDQVHPLGANIGNNRRNSSKDMGDSVKRTKWL